MPTKRNKPHQTGVYLCLKTPGLHQFRRQIILALCSGVSVNTQAYPPMEIGQRIVDTANQIIEASEQ